MPTINVEMMQKLLHEFTEKELLTGEEIKVIEQQVIELEGRIGICRDRLQYLNEDKDRLAAMMSRYVGGGNPPALVPRVSNKPRTTHSKLADQSQSAAAKNMPIPTLQSTPNLPRKDSIIEDLEPAAEASPGQNEPDNKEAAGGEDAIKSINDALKGLFRK